ncbi:MAG: hypothetical protein IAE78_12430 [Myxococcus sp.]|nr:hypothetical protein [Myxococcus sp.]
MPNAAWVVEAEVKEVVSTGPTPPQPANAKPGATSVGYTSASQTVKLTITNVLKGDQATELVVEKPVGPYSLRPGNKGPFLIDKSRTILGRYGPDSWHLDRVKGALE